jgi:hypothetical protein
MTKGLERPEAFTRWSGGRGREILVDVQYRYIRMRRRISLRPLENWLTPGDE